eukprot:7753644-Pyramimonas_sp.AAC.1
MACGEVNEFSSGFDSLLDSDWWAQALNEHAGHLGPDDLSFLTHLAASLVLFYAAGWHRRVGMPLRGCPGSGISLTF